MPSRVEFYTAEKRLRCTYEVQKSTNYLGSRLPLEFSVTHHYVGFADLRSPRSHAVGKVLSIATPERFEVPVEMSEALERVRR